MKQVWFSSDYHFAHRNIISYDKRPFKDVQEMEEEIVKRHNEVVGVDDDFYFLGDLCLSYTKAERMRVESLLWRLNGNKHYIKGNHDHKETISMYKATGEFLGEQKRITIEGIDVILNHFPMRTWNRSHHGALHLYGHHHGDIEHTPWGRSMDVGIMINNYYPFNWNDVRDKLLARDIMYVKGDHHSEGMRDDYKK